MMNTFLGLPPRWHRADTSHYTGRVGQRSMVVLVMKVIRRTIALDVQPTARCRARLFGRVWFSIAHCMRFCTSLTGIWSWLRVRFQG